MLFNIPIEITRHILSYLTDGYLCNVMIAIYKYDDISRDIPYKIMIFKAIESGDINLVKFVKNNWIIDHRFSLFESSLAAFRLYYDIYEYLAYSDMDSGIDQNMFVQLGMYDKLDPDGYLPELYNININIDEIACKYLLEFYCDNPPNYYIIMAICCAHNYQDIVRTSPYISYPMLYTTFREDNVEMYKILCGIFAQTSMIIFEPHTIQKSDISSHRDYLIRLHGANNIRLEYDLDVGPQLYTSYTYIIHYKHLLYDEISYCLNPDDLGHLTNHMALSIDLVYCMNILDEHIDTFYKDCNDMIRLYRPMLTENPHVCIPNIARW